MSSRVRAVRPYAWNLRTTALRRDLWLTGASIAMIIIVVVAVLGQLLQAAFGTGTVGGYDANALVWYIACAEAAVISVDNRLVARIGDMITSGEILMVLTRPLNFAAFVTSDALGTSLTRAAFAVPLSMATAFVIAGPPPSGVLLLTLLVTLPLAITAHIMQLVAVSAMTFWSNESRASWFVYQKLIFLLGGMLLPLELWPDGASDVLRLLPWAAAAYTPAHLATRGEPSTFALLVSLQLVWIVLTALLAGWLHAVGERRLVTEGG